MLAEQLPKQIRVLVDHLREEPESKLSLTDVAAVTEVLIATMQAYFGSIDTSIYRECRALSEYISNARAEIAALQIQRDDASQARLPRAGMELEAIVQQTEEATNTIMEAAETLMAAEAESVEDYQAIVTDQVMAIFEACSFQDITGQRVSKVVETLTYIEERVVDLRNLLGVTEADVSEASQRQHGDGAGSDDDQLVSGPALRGEGIDQDEIDQLLRQGRA